VKQRSFFLILLIFVLSFLSIGGGIFAWTLNSSSLNLLNENFKKEPLAPLFIPQQSPAILSLLVNPDSLENLAKWRISPWKRSLVQQDINQLETNLLKSTGLDYREQIQPWLGEELTLAITSLDYDHNPNNGAQPGYLLAVQTKDVQLAKEFLQAAYSEKVLKTNSELKFQQYKGVNLITQQSLVPKPNLIFNSSAVLADFVLFTNHPKILQEAINTLQVPDLSLNSSPSYKKALHLSSKSRLGLFYGNLPLLSAWLGNDYRVNNPEIFQAMTINLSLNTNGIVAQVELIDNKLSKDEKSLSQESIGLLKYTPSDSIFSLIAIDLPQLWNKVQTELSVKSPLQELIQDAIARLENNLDIAVSREVFPWIKGEFSLSLVQDPLHKKPQWLFIAERKPPEEALAGIKNLDYIASEKGLGISHLNILGKQATVWTQLTEDVDSLTNLKTIARGLHLNLNDKYEIFASSVEVLKNTLIHASKIVRPTFQEATIDKSKANGGYFYLNWEKFGPILKQKYPIASVLEIPLEPFLSHLKSLTLTSQKSEQGINQVNISFNLMADR